MIEEHLEGLGEIEKLDIESQDFQIEQGLRVGYHLLFSQ